VAEVSDAWDNDRFGSIEIFRPQRFMHVRAGAAERSCHARHIAGTEVEHCNAFALALHESTPLVERTSPRKRASIRQAEAQATPAALKIASTQ
jgi:hypothetical protein